MDSNDDVSTDENVLTFNVSDDALECRSWPARLAQNPALVLAGFMSALGQKQTSRHFQSMSALPPKADMDQSRCDVRFVPKADIGLRVGVPFLGAYRVS